MKINKDYVLRNVAGDKVIVPTGEASQKFNGLITLNEVGAFIWEHVEKVKDEEEMVAFILDNYEVEEVLARKDVYGFLQMLKIQGILMED